MGLQTPCSRKQPSPASVSEQHPPSPDSQTSPRTVPMFCQGVVSVPRVLLPWDGSPGLIRPPACPQTSVTCRRALPSAVRVFLAEERGPSRAVSRVACRVHASGGRRLSAPFLLCPQSSGASTRLSSALGRPPVARGSGIDLAPHSQERDADPRPGLHRRGGSL